MFSARLEHGKYFLLKDQKPSRKKSTDHHPRVGVAGSRVKSVTRLRTGEIRAFLELLQTPHNFFMELHTCTLPLKKIRVNRVPDGRDQFGQS